MPVVFLATVGAVVVATVVPAAATLSPSRISAPLQGAVAPPKFLLLGNSLALTLGPGLMIGASRWHVQFDDQGEDACAFLDGIQTRPPIKIRADGLVGVPNTGCDNWQASWAKLVKKEHPSVVGLVMGRWELYDYLIRGHWTHVGEGAWDAYLVRAMNVAVKVLSSGGATVLLFTTPYCSPTAGLDPNGIALPEDQPARADAYNALVRKVAAEHPGTVKVYDLNKEFTVSKDVYTPTIDGFTVRSSDGVHFTLAAGELLSNPLFSTVTKLALEKSH